MHHNQKSKALIFRLFATLIILIPQFCFTQSCEEIVESIYAESEHFELVDKLKNVESSCKSNWYYYRLALAQFQTNAISDARISTLILVDSMIIQAELNKDYILRSRAAILVYLFMEESRRLKDTKHFKEWKNRLKQLKIIDAKCGNGHVYRIEQVIYFMQLRFKYAGDNKYYKFYEQKQEEFKQSHNYWKKFRF